MMGASDWDRLSYDYPMGMSKVEKALFDVLAPCTDFRRTPVYRDGMRMPQPDQVERLARKLSQAASRALCPYVTEEEMDERRKYVLKMKLP